MPVTTSIDVRNPRTGKVDYSFTPPSPIEIEDYCNSLRNSQQKWLEMGLQRRMEVLQHWKEELLKVREELIERITTDTGRLKESIGEFEGSIKLIDRFCRLAPEILEIRDRKDTSTPFIKVGNDYIPYPLVGIISPWNFPYSNLMMDTIPALLAGCSVIVKPSEVTPRFVETVTRTIKNVPELAQVLKFVVGAGKTGETIIEHVDIICFTGSVSTGRKVAVAAANRFIPCILELGGKDPAIVLETADLERAANAILFGSVRNAGQLCVSIERIYVAMPVLQQFTNLLLEKAKKLELAYPSLENGHIGPLIFAKQTNIINDHLNDAIEKGAKILCGGNIENLGGGLYIRPTVVTNVDHRMKLMMEETFAPIMPIMPFSTIEEAIKLANDTTFGLTGSVFAGTAEEAIQVARKIHTGGISINDCGLTPFLIGEGEERTAFNFSGMGGSRSGNASILRFTRKKALFTNISTKKSPWWYEV